uniref:NADH-ubiquinone oxidoreductase chain 4L n=1 Tax=Ophionereis sp. TaxID=3135531 RepID=A0AAU6PX82_9ECHI
MFIFLFIFILSTTIALISLIYNKAFFLSLLIGLESILLNILIFNFCLSHYQGLSFTNAFPIFILTLSAVEASIGISIISLISRNYSTNNIQSLNTLKN